MGARVPREVLQAWDVPSYQIKSTQFCTPSGPAPSQPPIGWGTRIPQGVLNAWLPPDPMPILGSSGAVNIPLLLLKRIANAVLEVRVAVASKENRIPTAPAENRTGKTPSGDT
jgi:hypothetical protein